MDMFFNALVTLVAAFAGAFVAFRFEKSQRDFERANSEVAAGNRALFILVRIWNKLRQYQKEIVDDFRGKPDNWLNLPAGTSLRNESLVFSMNELTFVLIKDPTAFQLLFLEEDRFHDIAQLIDRRNELVQKDVFPRLSQAGIKLNEGRPGDEIEKYLTVGVVKQLTVLTTAIIRNVDEDVISCRVAFDKLRVALKVAHPKREFIEFPKEQKAIAENNEVKKA